jgi:hypothetical protein
MDTHCAVHHGSVALCPPPELADILDQLRDTGVHPIVTAPVADLDPCGGCAESLDWLPEDAVAVVGHTATDTPKAYRYIETACAACLPQVVAWHRRFAATWWVHIPAAVGQETLA